MERRVTTIEILLATAAIVLFGTLIILAINPREKLRVSRNEQRRAHVMMIMNAVHGYARTNRGAFPPTIPLGSPKEICTRGAADCNAAGLDLSVLSESFFPISPRDPFMPESATGSAYQIFRDPQGRITIVAPLAERGESIRLTR